MFPTGRQPSLGTRVRKRRRDRSAALLGGPFRRAVVYRIATMSPRKPNPARRTLAKVRIVMSQKRIFRKTPGIGEHHLQAHSVVLVRGHGPKDSPGINYHPVRGSYDSSKVETYGRKNRRSKFGAKKIKFV